MIYNYGFVIANDLFLWTAVSNIGPIMAFAKWSTIVNSCSHFKGYLIRDKNFGFCMTAMVILSPCFTCYKSLHGVFSSILNLFTWTMRISRSSENQESRLQLVLALQMRQSSSISVCWWNRLTAFWNRRFKTNRKYQSNIIKFWKTCITSLSCKKAIAIFFFRKINEHVKCSRMC